MKKAAVTICAGLLMASGVAFAQFTPGMDSAGIQAEVRARLARGESVQSIANAGAALLRGDEARLGAGSCVPFSSIERLTVALLSETAAQGEAAQRAALSALAGTFKISNTAVGCIYQAATAVGVSPQLAAQAAAEGSGSVDFLGALPATAAGGPPATVGSPNSVVAGISRGAAGFNNGFGFTLGSTLGGGGGRGISRN